VDFTSFYGSVLVSQDVVLSGSETWDGEDGGRDGWSGRPVYYRYCTSPGSCPTNALGSIGPLGRGMINGLSTGCFAIVHEVEEAAAELYA